MRHRPIALLAPLACALLLGACQKKAAGNSLDAMDNALINGAVTEGNQLARAIKVDPRKLGHGGQERPATTDLAALARQQAAGGPATPQGEAPAAGGDITERVSYSNAWAAKLPANLPMMTGATLSEAAGRDGAPCSLRVVSFTVPGDRGQVIGWYAAKAKAAGYTAERGEKDGDLLLAGDGPDGAAYVVMVGKTAGGRTPVDYVWSKS